MIITGYAIQKSEHFILRQRLRFIRFLYAVWMNARYGRMYMEKIMLDSYKDATEMHS